MSNTWFRMYAEFAHDPKVQMLSEAMQRRLVMMFCMRCNVAATLHDDELAFQLRISNAEWAETKAQFIAKGFIDEDNNLLNWDKRQFLSDSSSERSRKHRERKKQGMQRPCNVAATPPDTDTDTEQKDSLRSSSAQARDDEGGIFKSQSQKLIDAHTVHPRREEIRNFITRKLPHLGKQNCSEIDRWVELGADPDTDIYPTVETLFSKAGRAIGSYSYFTREIAARVESRSETASIYAAMEAKYAGQV